MVTTAPSSLKFKDKSMISGLGQQIFSCESQGFVRPLVRRSVGRSVTLFFTAENARIMFVNEFQSPMKVLNARPHPHTPAQTRVHAQFATIGRVPALFCKQIERACPNVYAELGSEMAKLGLEMAELRSEMAKSRSEMAKLGLEMAELGSEMTKSGSEMAELGSEMVELESEMAELESKMAELGSAMAK